jgi:uncharacterized membrane protein
MTNETSAKSKSLLPTNRIEALTDGIFAIAMTLMILNLEVPEGISPENLMSDLPAKLINVLPNFETYMISFFVLGVFWLRHQLQFKHIKNADRTLIFLNLVLLMLVGVIPFSTNVVMTYPDHHLPFNVYISNLIFIAVILHVHWAYAAKTPYMIDAGLPKDSIEKIKKINLVSVLLFCLSFIVAFISIRAALVVLYANPLFFYFYHKYKRYKGDDIEGD